MKRTPEPFSQTRRRRWPTSDTRKRTRKMKKMIFAIPAAASAIPVKPSTAAISAKIKNPNAQRSITTSSCFTFRMFQAQNAAFCLVPVFGPLPRFHPFVKQHRRALHTTEALGVSNECCTCQKTHPTTFRSTCLSMIHCIYGAPSGCSSGLAAFSGPPSWRKVEPVRTS
jgi:hypothetical protein